MSTSEQISSIDDAPEVVKPATATTAAAGGKAAKAARAAAASTDAGGEAATPAKRRHVTVHASSDETGQNAVEVGVNGVVYQIPRGVPCAVPDEVIHVLENAKISVYKTVDGVTQEHLIPRFAFSVTE